MRTILLLIVWNIPLGALAPWLLGLAIGRMPHETEEEGK